MPEEKECDHIIGMYGNEDVAQICRKSEDPLDQFDIWRFNFCADCGDKLKECKTN